MATAEYTPSPFPCSLVVVQTTGRRGKTFKFERKNWCVLGANDDCDIIVPFHGVAQLQALIHVKRNGVFLQGIDNQYPVRHPRLEKALLNEEEVLLLPGDNFLLGNREFLIEYSAEDVCIETNDAIAQTMSGESPSIRKTTPRPRRRRKSSIMVREFDETYVSPSNGSEKLLSETQLARVSQSEAEILPHLEEHSPSKEGESLSHHRGPQPCDEEQMCPLSFSSGESDVFSDEQSSISRIINFNSTNEDLHESDSCREERIPAASAKPSKVASEKKQRRNLVFDRLSKGLPATPGRREKDSAFGQHEARSQTICHATSSHEANVASGKENVPLYQASKSSDVKKDKDVHNKKGLEKAQSIRSPLANRVELENQASPSTTRTRTPTAKGLLESAKTKNHSAQTPSSRSVAFAPTIELAPGAHYSPFRPRKMTSKSGSAARGKRQAMQISGKGTHSATRPSKASPSTSRKEADLFKRPARNPGPVSDSQQFRKAVESDVLSMNTSSREAKPLVEYEDDSYPPTPSTSDGDSEALQAQILPEPSPMARVGEALAGFLKRLSGNFESDQEHDSSSEADGEYAHKRLSFSEDLNESRNKDMASPQTPMSPEPVMSYEELENLSQNVPRERRRDFVNQVLSAANDVRKVTSPVAPERHGHPHSSNEKITVTQRLRSPVEAKEEHASLEKLPVSERDPTNVSEEGEWQDSSKDDYEDNDTSTDESLGSEAHSSIDSGNDEVLECSRSTSLEVSGTESDTPDLEMEMRILRNVDVNDQLDETDDENAIEKDYGDDPWDDLEEGKDNEDDEREVAAVVLDDEVDIQLIPGFGRTPGFEKRIESEAVELQSEKSEDEKSEDEDEDSIHETPSGNFLPTAQLPRGDGQEVSPPSQESSMLDSSSATSDEVSSTEFDISSTSSAGKPHQKHEAGSAECGASSPEKKKEDSSRTAIPEHDDEIEISRRELSRLKKDELKKRLAQRGLDVEGLKKDLVERLAQTMVMVTTMNSEGGENLSESESQYHQKSDEEMIDLTSPSELSTCHTTPKRSEEQIAKSTTGKSQTSTRRLTRQSLAAEQATASSPKTPKVARDVESNVEPKSVPDVSLYRRRTMRELRQFLKNRGLDAQLKMRKDELIHHLISHSIGSDGQDVKESDVSDREKTPTANRSNTQALEKTATKQPIKSSQKMTVAQIRALLGEQGQCQAGTKKTLLQRLSGQAERRTRSRRVLDETSCALCQAGKMCEAAAKT